MRPPTKKELTDPQSAYVYACYIINKRWEQSEPIIATSPEYAYAYACDVIKGRFELGEPAIATDSHYAYMYARDIIKGRWEQGETIIATDKHRSYYYARNVLKFSIENKAHADFYEQCFCNKTLDIDILPKKLQFHDDVQVAYFKAKVLR
jgi:hypothetical protein